MRNGVLNDLDSESLVVPIDVSKYFHKGMILGPHGEVLEEPFEIDIYQSGFQSLLKKMEAAKQKTGAKRVVFALEPTSYYHQTLLEELKHLGHEVHLVNPYLVSKVRSLDFDHVKTDDIDVKSLGEVVRLGKSEAVRERSSEQMRLRLLTRQRMARSFMVKRLKTQIHQHVDAIWPGLTNHRESGKGLVRNIWESAMAWAILQVIPDPGKVSKMTPLGLRALFQRRRVKGIGQKRAEKIIAHAKGVIHKRMSFPEHRMNLSEDLRLLHHMTSVISLLEKRTVERLPAEAKYLLSIKGISPFYAAAFLSEIGSIANFKTQKDLISYAGLSVSVKQSGLSTRRGYLTKSGNRHLRYVVMMMSRNVARLNPAFKTYFEKFEKRGKPYRSALSCVATKLLKILWALLVKQEEFDLKKFGQ